MLQFLGLELGVMQGRLLPKYKGRFQAHPVNYWQSEFTLAKELGFTHIEFILDYNEVFDNPLLTDSGVQEIKKYINDTGVRVRSICADYFMEAPLHSMNDELAKNSLSLMIKLMHSVAPLGTECIVLPCVDQSSVKTETEKEKLIKVLQQLSKTCEELNITIALEMDFNPEEFHLLLKQLPETVSVNYDTGNSASLGYDIREEFEAYGHRITDIHIKDRLFGGGSVEIGKGNTKFERVVEVIKEIKYNGILVMQAFRDEEGINILKSQIDTLQEIERQYQ
jgi:L-ribulose-5-phosphate 3-epimerase